MTSRLHLRLPAASNLTSSNTLHGHHVVISQTSSQESPKGANLAGYYDQDLGKRTATNAHRHEPLHQHTSRRHKIERATGAVAKFSGIPMVCLPRYNGGTDTLAAAVRVALPTRPVSRRPLNRAPGGLHTFCTTVPQQIPVPRSMPPHISAKPRVVMGRAADVMRGRGVPSSRQDLREAEAEAERKIRAAEAIRLERVAVEEIRLQKITEARLQKIREAQEQEEERFKERLERIRLSMAVLDSGMSSIGWRNPLSTDAFIVALLKETRLHAQLVLVERGSHRIALTILQEFFGAKTSSAVPLPNMLDKLKLEREHRWTGLLAEILTQKKIGQLHNKINITSRATKRGLQALIGLIDEILYKGLPQLKEGGIYRMVPGQKNPRDSLVALEYLRPSLKMSYVSAISHDMRLWNMVALRNKLAPEIFAFMVRSTSLATKLSDLLESARDLWICTKAMGKRNSVIHYTLLDERIRILVDLIKFKAEVAKDIGWYISGFRLPLQHRAHNTPEIRHGVLIEAELARIVWPINYFALAGLNFVRKSAAEIFDMDKYYYEAYNVPDRLKHLRRELDHFISVAAMLTRFIHDCITEIIFWRGMQLQYQSQWGQASFPRFSHQPRNGIPGSVDMIAAAPPPLAHTTVERHTNNAIDDSKSPNVAPAGSPAISYVTTMIFAHTVLESFRSSSVLGLDILSIPGLDRVPSTSHRSQIQALVLATENHIAIFHIALFEGWDPLLPHIPALKEILESEHVLKVGVNMSRSAECLKNHTTIDMENFVDLNEYAGRHNLIRKTAENIGEKARTDWLSDLTAKYYGTKLPSLRHPEYITKDGLVRASYIQYLTSRSYAAVKLYGLLQRPGGAQGPTASPSLGPQTPGQFNILARHTGKITIDPHWQQHIQEGELYEIALLMIRSKVLSQVARSRETCLTQIVEHLVTTLINSRLHARTTLDRWREKAKMEGRREELKAMYLKIFFYERAKDILRGDIPLYSTRRILQIAKQYEVDIPPDRKAQLEAEIPIELPRLDPRERAETWLQSILKFKTRDILIARPSEIRSARQKLLREHRRDVLLLFAVWQVTPTSDTEIASWFSTTAEQVRSDVLLVHSLKLLRPVKHKLKLLLALTQKYRSSTPHGSYPHYPSVRSKSQISSPMQLLDNGTAGNEATAASKQRWSIATGPHRHRRLPVAAVRVKRREREGEKRKSPKLTESAALNAPNAANSHALLVSSEVPTSSARSKRERTYGTLTNHLYSMMNRLLLRRKEAEHEISVADRTAPLNTSERHAIRIGVSLEGLFVKRRMELRQMVKRHGLPHLPDIDRFPITETTEVSNSTLPRTGEQQARLNASSQLQPQSRAESRSQSRPQAREKARPSPAYFRLTSSTRRRLVSNPRPLVRTVRGIPPRGRSLGLVRKF